MLQDQILLKKMIAESNRVSLCVVNSNKNLFAILTLI